MERSEAGEGKPKHNTARRESVKHINPPTPVRGRGDLKATFRKVRDAQLALEPPAGRARRSDMNRSNSSRSLARRIASTYSANSRCASSSLRRSSARVGAAGRARSAFGHEPLELFAVLGAANRVDIFGELALRFVELAALFSSRWSRRPGALGVRP